MKIFYSFYVQWSVHLVICVNNYPTRCNFIYISKLLYIFRVVSPSIIRSSYHYIYSIWHYWDRNCYLSWTWLDGNYSSHPVKITADRAQLKPDGTRWRTVGELKGKHACRVGSQESCTLPQNMVYPALLPLLPLMRSPRLPVVDWTEPPPPPSRPI